MVTRARMSTPSRATICRRASNGPNSCSICRSCNIPSASTASPSCSTAGSRPGEGDRPCLIAPAETWTYADLAERVNRIANVLTRDLGLVPGNRVLLRAPNNPMMVAAYFAVHQGGRHRGRDHAAAARQGAVLSARQGEDRARPVRRAACRRDGEGQGAVAGAASASSIWGSGAPDALETLMAQPGYEHFAACDTAADDVCLIAFTSGTTGEPKGTMHFHRDLLAICDTYGRHVLRAEPTDRFIGSPPLAFTFGLGGLVLFPLRIGASTVLLEKARARRPAGGDRQPPGHSLLHRADRLSRHARQARRVTTSRRCANASRPARRCRRRPSRPGTRRPASRSSTASARPRCCTSSSARPKHEVRAGATGKPVPGYRGARPRRRRHGCAARHRRPPRGARPDRLPLSRRRAPGEVRAERLERHRRHLCDGCGRLLLVPGALRRHDHLRRLQHRRPRGRGGAADASGGRRMRRGRRARRGARPDRQGLCRAARRP